MPQVSVGRLLKSVEEVSNKWKKPQIRVVLYLKSVEEASNMCGIVPQINGGSLHFMWYCASNMWTNPQIHGECLVSQQEYASNRWKEPPMMEGALNLCDILPQFGGRILASVEKAQNHHDINCNQWK